MDTQAREAEKQNQQQNSLHHLSGEFDKNGAEFAKNDSKDRINQAKESDRDRNHKADGEQAQADTEKKDTKPQNLSIVSLSEIHLEDRLVNITEIYNVPMSPTSISIAFDTYLKRNVVLKKIFKDKMDNLQKHQAILELSITCSFNHYNLVKGYDHYENDNEYILLMELINDADYFQEKVENCHTPIKNELKLKSYMTDLLNGLVYIHEQGFIHCDLKLSNIFCQKHEADDEDFQIRRIKIGDLGLIQRLDQEKQTAFIEEICGTFGFKAPEVKKGAYITQKADIWSVGVILYLMTVAYMPHHMKGYKYGHGPVPFRDFDWKKRSPDLKDFVQKMLSLDPNERPSAQEALQHPFLSMCSMD